MGGASVQTKRGVSRTHSGHSPSRMQCNQSSLSHSQSPLLHNHQENQNSESGSTKTGGTAQHNREHHQCKERAQHKRNKDGSTTRTKAGALQAQKRGAHAPVQVPRESEDGGGLPGARRPVEQQVLQLARLNTCAEHAHDLVLVRHVPDRAGPTARTKTRQRTNMKGTFHNLSIASG